MAVHVAILMRRYLRLILRGEKTVESRLTRQARPPYRQIAAGERIYFKVSAGPFLATAVADRVAFHEALTPHRIDELRHELNHAICGDPAFWDMKRTSRFATFVWLRDVEPVDHGPDFPPSRGPAWFVLPDETDPRPAQTLDQPDEAATESDTETETFAITLSEGALRHHYVRVPQEVHRFPAAAYGGNLVRHAGAPLELIMPDGQCVHCDVRNGALLRWRGWGPYFHTHGLTPGDEVRFQREGPMRYRVHFVRHGLPWPIDANAARPPASPPDTPSTMTASTQPSPSPAAPEELLSRFHRLVEPVALEQLLHAAKREDLGPEATDLTSTLLIPPHANASAELNARQPGRLAGAVLLERIANLYDPGIRLRVEQPDGTDLQAGTCVARYHGPKASLLAMERIALNFLCHLSGIATLTHAHVAAVADTHAVIVDTRKTIPGLRHLAKYAVACGGGHNHRLGLHDAVLVKDNHLTGVPSHALTDAIRRLIEQARQRRPAPAFVEVEVDTLPQFNAVLAAQPDLILLDNMSPEQMRQAVQQRDDRVGRPASSGCVTPGDGVWLEASGGVSLDRVKAVGQSGVDRIAIGALTHSAPSLDLGLDFTEAASP